jgi:hypothetical protein
MNLLLYKSSFISPNYLIPIKKKYFTSCLPPNESTKFLKIPFLTGIHSLGLTLNGSSSKAGWSDGGRSAGKLQGSLLQTL